MCDLAKSMDEIPDVLRLGSKFFRHIKTLKEKMFNPMLRNRHNRLYCEGLRFSAKLVTGVRWEFDTASQIPSPPQP